MLIQRILWEMMTLCGNQGCVEYLTSLLPIKELVPLVGCDMAVFIAVHVLAGVLGSVLAGEPVHQTCLLKDLLPRSQVFAFFRRD